MSEDSELDALVYQLQVERKLKGRCGHFRSDHSPIDETMFNAAKFLEEGDVQAIVHYLENNLDGGSYENFLENCRQYIKDFHKAPWYKFW